MAPQLILNREHTELSDWLNVMLSGKEDLRFAITLGDYEDDNDTNKTEKKKVRMEGKGMRKRENWF